MTKRLGEDSVFKAAAGGLSRWLGRARDRVLAPWRQFKGEPDATAIAALAPAWQVEVDRIMAELSPALRSGWAAANLPGEYDPGDPYIQANLALTKNLLVRIPDEIHAKVIAQILEGANEGESRDQIAARVDDVLDYTGSENWPGRAMVIAQTETNRHYNGSLLAHGLLREKNDGGIWLKEWQTITDDRERLAHRLADHDKQPLGQPFIVDNEPLLFPGDPRGKPSNVINCRCGITLEKVSS